MQIRRSVRGRFGPRIRGREAAFVLFLVLVGAIAYWPLRHAQFIALDDDLYITNNPWVRAGLTVKGFLWAFSGLGYAANWHPLTWVSHMLDVQLFGLNAGWHHLSSVLLHLGNTAGLFFVLRSFTGVAGPSAVVAALFALHPLHVESVAWVAERKDLLSTFFGLATLAAYRRHLGSPGATTFWPVFVGLTLGLLSKPMLVTLPLLLLLLDYWPLGRPLRPALLREKIPLLALCTVSAVVTFLAQSRGGAMASALHYPLPTRLANAAISYVLYLWKTLWPSDLAVYYPHAHGTIPAGMWIGASAILVLLTVAATARVSSLPFLFVGWAWFFVSLLPVIGIVQIGDQAMADRYMYLPLVGLLIIAVWGVRQAAARWRHPSGLWAGAGVALAFVGLFLTNRQAQHWRDNRTLAEHAIAVTTGNWMAYAILGYHHLVRGENETAAALFREGLRYNPRHVYALDNLGAALLRSGRTEEAIDILHRALAIDPADFSAHNNFGIALKRQGRITAAVEHFQTALRLRPDAVEARINLGAALVQEGRAPEALALLTQALLQAPEDANAHYHLAVALETMGRRTEAARHYRETLRISPGDAEARLGLSRVEPR